MTSTIRKFDLNLLIIFEALVSESHVSRAAEKVFLSQSAMSHALNRLREQLGDPILVRSKQGLQPTQRAQAMLPEVRRSLKLIEQTIATPEVFNPVNSCRQFRIACTNYFEVVVFPVWFSQLTKQAPNIRIDIEVISEDTVKALEEGSVDLIVGLDKNQQVAKHLSVTPWIQERQICLASTTNRIIGGALNLQEYLSLDHVSFVDVERESFTKVDDWLNQQGLSRRCISMMCNHLAAARIASQTDAIITLPYRMAHLFTQFMPLRMVLPPEGIPDLEMTIIQHPGFASDPAVNWLAAEIASCSTPYHS